MVSNMKVSANMHIVKLIFYPTPLKLDTIIGGQSFLVQKPRFPKRLTLQSHKGHDKIF